MNHAIQLLPMSKALTRISGRVQWNTVNKPPSQAWAAWSTGTRPQHRNMMVTNSTPVSRIPAQASVSSAKEDSRPSPINLMLKAGLPFVLFSVLAAWVVSNALDGKLKELEASQGKVSKSIRQAKMEEEHDEMLERLNKIVETDFDNTKRIKRPHEVLEERRQERERRNAWHRRAYRAVFGDHEKKS